MLHYERLSEQIERAILTDMQNGTRPDLAFDETRVIRRADRESDAATIWRTAFIRDIDKILHCPYYNR
jgi:dGTPase